MRPVAEYIMRGRVQATLVAGVAAAIPALFWLAGAAAALVLMRKGSLQSANVIIAALVPAFIWAVMGDPFALLAIATSLLLAGYLRNSMSWRAVLLLGVGLGLVWILVLQLVFGQTLALLAAEVSKLLPVLLGDAHEQLAADELQRLDQLLIPVLTGLLAAAALMLGLLSLMLARYWQAALYNPGGFRQEFHSIRLPRIAAALLVFALLLAPNMALELAGLTPVCAVALVIAGISCVHGLAGKYQLARFWLVVFYLALVFVNQLVFPLLVLLALIDSLFDLRGLSRAGKDNA